MDTYSLTPTDQRSALERAVVISLFTWRRAEPSDPVDDAERQGWWGDSYPSYASDRIGSRLWLLRRRSLTPQTLRDAERYAKEALQWLIEDGHVTSVSVTVARYALNKLSAVVALSRPEGDPISINIEDLQVSYAV